MIFDEEKGENVKPEDIRLLATMIVGAFGFYWIQSDVPWKRFLGAFELSGFLVILFYKP